MSEQTCETCGQQMPAPPQAEEPVRPILTVEDLDCWQMSADERCEYGTLGEVTRFLSRFAEAVGSLRPLVERKECEDRMVAAGFRWQHTLRVDGERVSVIGQSDVHCERTFPDAADWAEAQAAKRERWSEPVTTIPTGQRRDLLMQLGGPAIDGKWESAHYLRGWADHAGLYDPDTDRVKLPPEATP